MSSLTRRRPTRRSAASLEAVTQVLMPIIEAAMHRVFDARPVPEPFYGLMRYHLGWADEQLSPVKAPTSKRLRPLVCLLACRAVGGEIEAALPAAVAIELLHNFSLIHDDVEAGDVSRQDRPTVWYLWGTPHAINAGDGLHVLAYSTLLDLTRSRADAPAVVEAMQLLAETSLRIAEGQYLDLAFEAQAEVDTADYLAMIGRKAAAISQCAVGMGARLGGGTAQEVVSLERFGEALGMAYQLHDDILGLWTVSEHTGKPSGDDLARRKKTYPSAYALAHTRGVDRTILTRLFETPEPSDLQVQDALRVLERVGARGQAQQLVAQFSALAQEALASLPMSASREALQELLDPLVTQEE